MASKKEVMCSCGAAFDSKGVCTRCGKKRQRSKGYRIGHSILCVLGTLALLCCMTTTLTMQEETQTGRLTDGIRLSRLSDASVPGLGTVSGFIKKNYVTDPAILDSDIASAIDGMGIPAFAADKLEAHFEMLRGNSDAPVEITAEEVTALLENNKEALHQSCQLTIEQSDIDSLHTAVDAPLTILNIFNGKLAASGAGRAILRFGAGIGAVIFDLLLAGLLLWRWMNVHANSGADKAGAFRAMGRTVLIPSVLGLVFYIVIGVTAMFASDAVIGLHPLMRAAALPLGLTCAMESAAGLLLFSIGKYLPVRAQRATEASKASAVPERNDRMPELNVPQKPAVPTRSTPKHTAEETKCCVSCGKELRANAKFCIYCGTNQDTGSNVLEDVLSAPAVDETAVSEQTDMQPPADN